jgi:hypothetical protein
LQFVQQVVPTAATLVKVDGATLGTQVFTLRKVNTLFRILSTFTMQHPEIKEMMLTGGSPTMHPKLVNELTHFANERQIIITIETEGSAFLQTDYPIGLISFSPKFSNSVPVLGGTTPLGSIVDQKFIDTHNRLRLNKDAITKSMAYHSDYHMKVVVNPVEMPETWAEIRSFMDELEVPKDKIWIMPPGDNREELIRVYPMVIQWCTDNTIISQVVSILLPLILNEKYNGLRYS